jgi:FkbM family methyltransferase
MPDRVDLLSDRIALVRGRHGTFLVNRHDIYLGQAMMAYGEYGEQESEVLNQFVLPDSVVIEVGAHVGTHTVALARRVGSGMVIAIEPQPEMFHLLCANIALNVPATALPMMVGAGRMASLMTVPAVDYTTEGNFGGVTLTTGGPTQIQVVRLDDLTFPGDVSLIKIDVEGMEVDVIEGAADLIAKHRPILYVENDRADKSAALINAIRAKGYQLWWHLPPLFNPANFFGEVNNRYPNVASCNMICIPTERPSDISGLKLIDDLGFHPLYGRID